MDLFEANLDRCRKRLEQKDNITFYKNDWHSFLPVEDASLSAIFCYDAMVHFSPDIVEAYLHDTFRVLAQGGMALFHHSNHPAPLDRHYGQNIHARNHMTKELFAELAAKSGMAIAESIVIPWGGVENLDCVTLLHKS